MTPRDDGPTLQQYVETRFNLLTEQIKDAQASQASALGSAIEATKAAIEAADLRYQQRFDASEKSLALAFAGQKSAVEAAFAAQKEAINAALAAADRAVAKAEAASEKRFEGVNEFRQTLSDQQRTLIPRAEVDVLVKALEEKIIQLTKQADQMQAERQGLQAERQGLKGGWGYAVGVVGFVLTLVTLGLLIFRAVN